MKHTFIGFPPGHGAKKGDLIEGNGILFRVLNLPNETTITARTLFWYERLWLWLKRTVVSKS